MADKYIDKIKYSDRYFLLDSGATHDSNHNLSGTAGNFETTGTIKASTGIFNELIATTLSARTAKITELTAQNATVMGIMDVKGKLMTNSWEAASIANVGGNFYISPTGKDSGTPNVSITCNSVTSGAGTYTITVSKGSSSGQGNGFGVSSTSSSLWSSGSRVLMTGNVKFGTKNYPLGSLDGLITSITTSSNTITSITINTVVSSALDLIFTEQSTLAANSALSGNSIGSNMQISLYQSKSGDYFYPIGILLSSYGQSDKQQYIDIYGGAIKLGRNEADSANLTTGMAEPTLRIGQLDGLPNIVANGGSDTLPGGWGIYTTNGFFKGKIVSNAGRIAGWNISDTALYNGSTGINNTTSGAYLGYATNNTGLNISGGSAATTITIANSNFTKSINGTPYTTLRVAIGSNFGMDSSGNIYANGANITNINAGNIAAGNISADRLQTNVLSALQANLTNANTKYLSAIVADIGTITAGVIKHDTVGGTNGIWFSAATNTSSNVTVGNSGARKDWRLLVNNKFGVTTAGNLYASSADITGAITATSLKIGSGSTDYANDITTISSKASVSAEYSVSIVTSNFNPTATSGTLVTLTAKVARVDGTAVGTISYKWYGDNTEISGATSASYNVPYNTTYNTFTVEIS